MKRISAGDASQLVRLIHRINRGVPADIALQQIVLHDEFALEIARAIAGGAEPADAQTAATQIRELVGAASTSRPPAA